MTIELQSPSTFQTISLQAAVWQRVGTVALAALILFIRFPTTFTAPEFWAEDGILISNAYNHGLASLFETLGGTYFNSYGSTAAFLAVHASPATWPWVTTYAAHLAALIVVFMVMSPRFDMPFKIVAALAIVATPIQDNVFGGLANAQWILPLSIFVLAFCRAHHSKAVLYVEAAAIVFVGLEGPLGCFLVPIFAARAVLSTGAERRRLIILGLLLSVSATVQIISIALDLRVFRMAAPMPYDPWIWVTMPLRWLDAIRLAGIFANSAAGPVIAAAVIVAAIWFAARKPHDQLKLSMLFFAGIILYSGMIKFRHGLYLFTNDRYVYVGSVFFFWFLCLLQSCAAGRRQAFIILITTGLLVTSVARRTSESRPGGAAPWSMQAHLIGSGPGSIPIPPGGAWFVRLER